MDFETVASEFEARPELYAGGGMQLAACFAASTGLAPRLAKRLSTWILAPTHECVSILLYSHAPPDDAIVWEGGNPEVFFWHPDDVAEGACWILFDPEGKEQARTVHDAAENSYLFTMMQANLKAQYGPKV